MRHKTMLFPAFVAIITLLLQIISFATTWQGAAVYLESIFPLASFLFAAAIQATVWFFSNGLRYRIRPQRLIALALAVCCSTYFSYIGICNAVNPIQTYLQETYTQIYAQLTAKADTCISNNTADVIRSVNNAYSYISGVERKLLADRAMHDSLAEELTSLENTKTNSLRAPSRSQYEDYEAYVAAYQAYVLGAGQAGQAESSSNREKLLLSYGYSSMEEYLTYESTLTAALTVFEAEDGFPHTFPIADYTAAVRQSMESGMALSADQLSGLEDLYHYYDMANIYNSGSSSSKGILSYHEVTRLIQESSGYHAMPAIPAYSQLIAALSDGRVTNRNIMALKTSMDAAIASQLLALQLLLPSGEAALLSDSDYIIEDIYLLPIRYLISGNSRMSAYYCLLLAALIDGLTLVLAISLFQKKPVWHRQYQTKLDKREWEAQMTSFFDAYEYKEEAIKDFLSSFSLCSSNEERDGYALCADLSGIQPYQPLLAILNQSGMALVRKDKVLLKPAFLYWANIWPKKEAHYE